MRDKQGKTNVLAVLAVVALLAIAGSISYLAWSSKSGEKLQTVTDTNGDGTADAVDSAIDDGVPLGGLSATQQNTYTKATEGSNDLEFWAKGANVADTTLSPQETITLSSGAVTDTSIANVISSDTEATKDLWVEGASTYYDSLVPTWKVSYNIPAGGNGKLIGPGQSGAVVATKIGTITDIDTPNAVDTGLETNVGGGTVNYSISGGDGTVYIDLNVGNDVTNTELQSLVFCIGDADGDLSGNEMASMTFARRTGDQVDDGKFDSNVLTLFNKAAGTGKMYCAPFGTVTGLKNGVYRLSMDITEANFAASEEFEIGFDDLGDWKVRQYPSGNLKATAEDLVVARVA